MREQVGASHEKPDLGTLDTWLARAATAATAADIVGE
jgi:hypothetical protein